MKKQISLIIKDKGSHVESIGPDATVAVAVRRMNEHSIGSLLVLDDGRPIGIFTERDVLVKIVADELDAKTTLVRDVMSTPLVTVPPETTVEEAMLVMTKKRCRHLPVMSDDTLVALISIGDLTRSLIRDQRAEIQDLVSYITWS